MLAEMYFKERYERGRQKGREEEAKVWRAWYERMRAAQAEGKPFDEPPPSLNGADNG